MPILAGTTDIEAVLAPLNQLMVLPLVKRLILAEFEPQTVAFTPCTVIGDCTNMPTVVVALQTPEVTVAVKLFKPNAIGVNVAGLEACPLLQAKAAPLVVSVYAVGEIPHIVGTTLAAMVTGAVAVSPTDVITLQKTELTVIVNVFNPKLRGVKVAGLVACPELQLKLFPLVFNVKEVGVSPHTVALFPETVTGDTAVTPTVVTIWHTLEVMVTG